MKALLFLLACWCITPVAFGQGGPSQFTVSGYGRVFYEPDAFDLSFRVVTHDPDVQKCKAAHLAALATVKEFLDKNQDKIISLKEQATRLETVSGMNNTQLFEFTTGYVARVRDAKSLMPIQEGLITAGVNRIESLDLFSEKLPKFIEEARKNAIHDAKTKAELAASELGWTLSGAVNVSFQEQNYWANDHSRTSENPGFRGYTYNPGNRPELTTYVTSDVTVTFAFDQKKK